MPGFFNAVDGLLEGPQTQVIQHQPGGGRLLRQIKQQALQAEAGAHRPGILAVGGQDRGELLQPFRIRFAMEAVDAGQTLLFQPFRHRPVGQEHRFLDQLVAGVAGFLGDLDGHAIDIQLEPVLDAEQVQCPGFFPVFAQDLGDAADLLHGTADIRGPLALGVLVDQDVHRFFVGKAMPAFDQGFRQTGMQQRALAVDGQEGAQAVPGLVGHQAA